MEIHYSHWKEEHRSILETFSEKAVFLFYSGGKDSSLALDFVSKAGKDFGFDIQVHGSAFPVHRYTAQEKGRLDSYWNGRGVRITWHDVGAGDDAIKDDINPCLPCQKLRKGLLKTILAGVEDWENLVLIISFSLWDLVGYTIEHILGDIYIASPKKAGNQRSKRFIETSQRFYPVLRMKEGYIVFRPLIKYNGSDILKSTVEAGIPLLSMPCQFRDYRPKRRFEKYYEGMGLRFDYEQVFAFAKKTLQIPDPSFYSSIEKETYLRDIF